VLINHLSCKPDAIVLSNGLLHGNGSPLNVVVALKVKFTILESGCANKTWMCSARCVLVPEHSFAMRWDSNGRTGREKVRRGEAEVE
jgi:hypothetical protein